MEDPSSTALKFIITGGGIAGLTCAYMLRMAGRNVVVLEKSSRSEQLANQTGGVRIPPNMSRLLQELPGTEKLLMDKAMKCAGVLFYQCNGNEGPTELVGKMDLTEEIVNDLGCDFYFMPHKDLHNHLYTLCTNAGVQIHHKFEVVEVLTSKHGIKSRGPMVVGRSGEQIAGNIVIGADGKNSVTRKVILAEEEAEEQNLGTNNPERLILSPIKAITGAVMSIPVSLIKSDPELAPFLRTENYGWIFMGTGMCLSMSQHGSDLYLLDLTYGVATSRVDDYDEEWLSGGTPVEKVLERAEEYDPNIKKLIQLAVTSHWYIHTVHNLSRHVSKLHEVVLIGDSAHSIRISDSQNTAAAFEEAFTLGRLFSMSSCCSSEEHPSFLLNAYQQIQRKRTRELEVNDMDAIVLLGLPPGREREGRNNNFRMTLDLEGADDATLEHMWAEYIPQFNYDARDAVDEWCLNWSRLGHRRSSVNLGVSVTTASAKSSRPFFC